MADITRYDKYNGKSIDPESLNIRRKISQFIIAVTQEGIDEEDVSVLKKICTEYDKNDVGLFLKFYDFLVNNRNNKSTIKEKTIDTVNRDIDIYIDKKYYKYTYRTIAENYGISTERARQLVTKLEFKFIKFCNADENTISRIGLDIRTLRCLERIFDVDNDSVDKLYNYDKAYYLKLRNFGEKSLEKLNKALRENGYKEIE
jgi:hypothetical protein